MLRRLSTSQNTVFCGRIQLFLARLFPLSEKSGEQVVIAACNVLASAVIFDGNTVHVNWLSSFFSLNKRYYKIKRTCQCISVSGFNCSESYYIKLLVQCSVGFTHREFLVTVKLGLAWILESHKILEFHFPGLESHGI